MRRGVLHSDAQQTRLATNVPVERTSFLRRTYMYKHVLSTCSRHVVACDREERVNTAIKHNPVRQRRTHSTVGTGTLSHPSLIG